MITKLICNNCNENNPLYSLNCRKCNSYLRARVPNIDLWDTIGNILTSPTETAIKIIQAEKKNFIGFLLSIWIFKATINFFIISNYLNVNASLFESFIKGGLLSVLVIYAASFLINVLIKLFKEEVRYIDFIAIYTYSLIPIILSFVFLTPFHIALYGFYWYTINPSPLVIKPIVSYVLYSIEGLFLLWVLLLFVFTTYVQISKKKVVALLIGVCFFLLLFGYQLFLV